MTKSLHCPLCGSTEGEDFEHIKSFELPLTYLICRHCGFVYQDPASGPAYDPDFYAEKYRLIYQASVEPSTKDLRQQTLRAAEQLRWLKSLEIAELPRVLDIGASAGLLLEAFRAEYASSVCGVEPGDAYRRVAEAKDLHMFTSLDALLAECRAGREAHFNLVSLMHVLEHLPEPLAALRQIREELLEADGMLLVEVPNFYAHDSYELAHLSCFTPQSLVEMLKQAGFKLLAFRTHGQPRSAILPLYLNALALPAGEGAPPEALRIETGVARKRKIGLLRRKVLSKLMPAKTWLPMEDK